jgi:hypothetical protein
MPRKPAKVVKPPLPAICAAFSAGHRISITAQGPRRERLMFSAQALQKAMAAMGAKRARATDVLAWMSARGLVAPTSGRAVLLTDKGAHVTDRACSVLARRRR